MTRPVRIEGDVAYVPLTRGYEAIIDAADVPLVDKWSWCARVERRSDGSIRTVYAIRNVKKAGRSKMLNMHRIIAGTPVGMVTDHIDGNGLNNRRDNLRHASIQQNSCNRRRSVNNTSGVKGVSFEKARGKWRAQIAVDGKPRLLGLFASIDEAAAEYKRHSAELHGEFGRVE